MHTVFGIASCMAVLFASEIVLAQDANYPSRPVTLIMATGPGNVADKETRAWTGKMADNLGKPFVLDFKVGAGSTLAARQVMAAKPDGYTLGVAITNHAQMRLRYKDLPFDPVSSFEWISMFNSRSGLIAVHPSLPINNIKEYVAYARANPGALNWAASGEGSSDHFIGGWLMKATNTQVTFINYKVSSAGYADFLAGRVQMISIPYDAAGGYTSIVKAGKGRNIGTTSKQRSLMAPEVPTLQEQGVTDFDMGGGFIGLYAPGKTPPAIINKLHAEIVKVSKDPDLRKQIGDGAIIVANTPAEFKQSIIEQEDRYRKLAQDLNITLTPD